MIKDIIGYEGLYRVSDEGYIICCEKRVGKTSRVVNEQLLRVQVGNGYARIELSKNDIKFRTSVHRVVAQTFLEAVPGKDFVNHKDGNKLNNHVSNLEWVTRSENEQHALEIGLRPKAKKVLQFSLNGVLIREWVSTNSVQKELGFGAGNIHKCCNDVISKAYKFKWSWA